MKRAQLKRTNGGGNYFSAPATGVEFFSSGCRILDLALGGGWAKNRVANIIGDKSTGKTLLMIEACANFAMQYPKGRIYYREAEAAFDRSYAEALGMPIDRIDFGEPLDTVEDMFEDLSSIISRAKKNPILYIIDSLDALSNRAELQRAIDQGSFGAEKAKKMSELFRRLASDMAECDITLLIVSQVRQRIGIMYGPKTTRSGGSALDFYASQVLYLSQRKTLVKTIGKIKRVTGMWVHAKVAKNKVGLPFREAEFPIKFGWGIDDYVASAKWLEATGIKDVVADQNLNHTVTKRWYEIERRFLPTKRKYQ